MEENKEEVSGRRNDGSEVNKQSKTKLYIRIHVNTSDTDTIVPIISPREKETNSCTSTSETTHNRDASSTLTRTYPACLVKSINT